METCAGGRSWVAEELGHPASSRCTLSGGRPSMSHSSSAARSAPRPWRPRRLCRRTACSTAARETVPANRSCRAPEARRGGHLAEVDEESERVRGRDPGSAHRPQIGEHRGRVGADPAAQHPLRPEVGIDPRRPPRRQLRAGRSQSRRRRSRPRRRSVRRGRSDQPRSLTAPRRRRRTGASGAGLLVGAAVVEQGRVEVLVEDEPALVAEREGLVCGDDGASDVGVREDGRPVDGQVAEVEERVGCAGAAGRAGASRRRSRHATALDATRSSSSSGARSATRRKSPSVVPVEPLSTLRGPRSARTSSTLMVRRS